MKKFTFLFLILFILSGFSLMAQTSTLPENGDGSISSPYEIATLDNLYWLSQTSTAWNSHFVQTADIDAADSQNWDDGAGFTPIGFLDWGNLELAFTGSYDGQEHTISNITINRPSEENLGLFGFLSSSGTIKNIGLVDVDIIGKGAGALVGTVYDRDVSISNCYSTGNIKSKGGYTGGLVAWFAYGKMDQCYNKVTIEGTVYAGGLVGYCLGGKIYNSYSCGDISVWSDSSGPTDIGGLIGHLNADATVVNCFSTGHVGAAKKRGGLIGSISDSNSKVTNCFWDIETSGITSSAAGMGKTTEEMQALTTYFNTNWDFPGTWHIDETEINPDNNGYPSLTWQGLANVNSPIVHTLLPTEVLSTTVTLNGTIAYQGASTASEHGFVWNTTGLPVVEDNPNKTEEGAVSATGAFSSSVIGLSSDKTYYVRAYATNDLGTVYGDEINFRSKRVVTITGSFTVDNKDYDRTTIATLKDNNLILNGLSLDDQVLLTNIVVEFASADPLPDQTVSITSAELSGPDASSYTLSLDGAPTTIASIQLVDYQLTINAIPLDGGTVSDGGRYLKSDVIHLIASPFLGYEFMNWSGDVEHLDDASSASPVLTMPNVDVNLTANFELIDYQLSLNYHPMGAVSGGGAYNMEAIVAVSAIPVTGYQFVNWTDVEENVISTEAAFNYIMPANNVTLTANFELIDYQLSLNVTTEAEGTTSGSGTYNMGETVAISATPATGYQFVNWTDAEENEISNQTPFDYTMPADNVTLTANFELIHYQLSINFNPESSGTASGGGAYNMEAIVAVSATPATGYQFINWTDVDEIQISSEADFNYNMPADDVVLTANFAITLPFFEGFENCSDQETVESWGQASVFGYNSWLANSTETTYNRAPHTGNYNAYLDYTDSQWLFTPTFIELKSSKKYEVSLYARQAKGNASDATITLKYGITASPEGMTGVIKNPTGVVNGDYQLIEGMFSPNVDGLYYIGILGTTNYESKFVSIDDISIAEVPASDAALTKILNPVKIVEANSEINFTVLLKNKGLNNLTEVNIDWYINNYLEAIDIQTFSWTGNLAIDEEEEVVLTKTTLSTPGENNFSASINWAEDMRVENNTLEKSVYVATQACGYTVHLVDDYGDGWDGTIGFMQNGLLAGTFGEGFNNGSTFGPVTIDLWDGVETQIVVVYPEEYSDEVGFTVLDRLGEVVYHRDPGEEFDADFVFHTFTPTCALPENDVLAVSIDVPTFIGLAIPTNMQGAVQNLSSSEKTFEATLAVYDETDVQKFETTVQVTLLSLESETIDFGEWKTIEEGPYYVELTVFLIDDEEPDNDSVSKEFFAVNGLLWGDNGFPEMSSNGTPSVNLGGMDNGLFETADDFILPVGSWRISSIMVDGEQIEGVLTGYQVRIYTDAEGVPGEIIHQEIVETTDDFDVELNFSEPIVLEGGHYWLMVAGHYPDASFFDEGLWVWKTWDNSTENKFMFRDNSNILGLGTSWLDPQFIDVYDASTIFWILGEEMLVNLDVVADPVGMGWVNGEESLFMEVQAGTQTTLTATAATGYQFISWTDAEENVISSEAAFDYTMPAKDATLTANFELVDYQLSLNADPNAGGLVSNGGAFNMGAIVAVSVIAETGYQFVNWTDAEENVISSEAVFNYTMPAKDATLTANFELVDYQLSLNADPIAGGLVSNGGAFNMGAIVAVYATPAKGYHFVNWTDAEENVISTEAAFDYTMPAKDATLTANFELIDYQLSLNADPNAGGLVSNGGAFNMGAIVAVSATPAKGYHFVNWTDAEENVISSEVAFNYTMPAKDATLTANFEVITLLNKTEETKLLVWPNPFDIEINIKGGSSIKHISIVTQLGEIIFKTALPVSQIQTSHFSPGVYILKIEDDAGQFTIYKLIKK